jgi:hypothetical protein
MRFRKTVAGYNKKLSQVNFAEVEQIYNCLYYKG